MNGLSSWGIASHTWQIKIVYLCNYDDKEKIQNLAHVTKETQAQISKRGQLLSITHEPVKQCATYLLEGKNIMVSFGLIQERLMMSSI